MVSGKFQEIARIVVLPTAPCKPWPMYPGFTMRILRVHILVSCVHVGPRLNDSTFNCRHHPSPTGLYVELLRGSYHESLTSLRELDKVFLHSPSNRLTPLVPNPLRAGPLKPVDTLRPPYFTSRLRYATLHETDVICITPSGSGMRVAGALCG